MRPHAARFDVEEVAEVRRDPEGHAHHWTVLVGRVEHGVLRVGDELSIPRVGGGAWLGAVIGFRRSGEQLTEASADGRVVGVAVWGVAPPKERVALGGAIVVTRGEAAALAARLREEEPAVVHHCADCRRLIARFDAPRGV